jgi:hypothetical protein
MSTTTSWPNPRDHPDNAHLPNINKPEALIGLTIAFLVGAFYPVYRHHLLTVAL